MAVHNIRKKTVTISIPIASYQGLCQLAENRGLAPAQYVRFLVMKHLEENGLPLYYDDSREKVQKEKE